MTTNDPRLTTLEDDLDSLYAADIPDRPWNPPAFAAHRPHISRGWRFAGAGALAASLVAAIAFLPGYLGGAQPANAEELLNQSAAATAELRSSATTYHLRARFEGAGTDFVAETWSFGSNGNRSESRDLAGNLLNGQVATPTDYWMYAQVDGELRVAHVAGSTVRVQDFVAGMESLDEIIQGFVIEGCQSASVQGSAVVAGRDSHVVRVEPTPDSCKPAPGQPARKEVGWAQKLGGYTVWIDKETNVQLQFEARDSSGAVTKRYSAELFKTGSSVSSQALAYTPPAAVTLFEAADYSEAKSALYSGTTETRRQEPVNPKQ